MPGKPEIVAMLPDPALAEEVRTELAAHCDLDVVTSTGAALAHLEANPSVDLAVLPEATDEGSGVARAADIHRLRPDLPILVLSEVPESRNLKAALHGNQVTDAVRVPWRPGELLRAVERVRELGRVRREIAELRRQSRRRVENLSAMNELTVAIADADSVSELVGLLARGLFRVTPEGIGAALLVIDDRAELHLRCHQPAGREPLRAARDRCLEIYHALTGWTVDEDKLTVDISGERRVRDDHQDHTGIFTHVPIHRGQNTVGVLVVEATVALSPVEEKQMYFLASRAAATVKRLETRRDDERRRLSLMVEAMADGLVFTDASSDEVLINPSARRMLGIELDLPVSSARLKEVLGFHPRDLVGARAGGATALIREELRAGERSLHSLISPVRDRTSKLVGVVVVLRDITEAKKLAIRQSEFVSVVSHELRTPLTSIAGVLDILISEVPGRVTRRQKRYLEMARDSCNQLNAIVDDLLDVARSDNDGMPVQFTPLALDELTREAVTAVRHEAEAKRIELRIKSEAASIRIVGDEDRLNQVLANLLSNAIKFTPAGGEIEVDAFGSSVVEGHVGVSVYNTGEPIPAGDRERVFAKFEQLEDASTRQVGGAGLGLPISRSIIEAHGGRIWAESLDEGTRFVFILPVAPSIDEAEDDVISEPHVAPLPPARDPGGTVLIVDNDQHSIFILKGILIGTGYEVLTAEDPDSALSQARTARPDLAVISTSVTEGAGTDLLEIFTHDPDMRKTAVLVVSSSARDREAATRAGAEEFLQKPVNPGQFRETITRLIQEAGRVDAHRILVVDDDPTIRLVCREILEGAGYAVRDVEDGPTALTEAKRFRPDLLLLDVMMPKMDGFRTAELLRADQATSMTPIIFVSAKGETSDKVRAFRAGAEDYVVKPFDAQELVARVAKSLERQARELGASPTTQLPGADAIETEIERRLLEGGTNAFCYLDLDNLKAFNDYYGYAKADGVIRQTGDIIRDIIAREGRSGDFIGHIAGDDFVYITSADRVSRVCKSICDTFDRLVPLYYDKADREKGYIEAKDRYGVLRRFPIMTVSVAVVTNEDDRIQTYTDLAAAAAAGKKLAKELAGSSYVLDGQVILGDDDGPATDGGS